MKQDLRKILLAMMLPLFLIFILYIIKILEVGMDWDFTRLGVYPMEQRGMFGIFAHPLIHSNFAHLFANTLPLFFLTWCLFYFYRGIAPYILHYLDRLRCHYFYHRKTRMAHRSKRCDLRIGFFLVFQWIIAKIRPSDCHFIIGYFLIWRTRMANVPLLYTCQYFMGRAS